LRCFSTSTSAWTLLAIPAQSVRNVAPDRTLIRLPAWRSRSQKKVSAGSQRSWTRSFLRSASFANFAAMRPLTIAPGSPAQAANACEALKTASSRDDPIAGKFTVAGAR
jgi:hypothetical protein